MSFGYDIESAVKGAIHRGSHADYVSYGRPSRRGTALGIPGPRLENQGPDFALVVALSGEAAAALVEEAREALESTIGQFPLRSYGVVGPEEWASWALNSWRKRKYGGQSVDHVLARPGDSLQAVEGLERSPSMVVVVTNEELNWPDLDAENVVVIAVPSRLPDGTLIDPVGTATLRDADIVRPELTD